MSPGFGERTRWSIGEAAVGFAFAAFAIAYAVFLPSFEGPDESEHARYIQAWAEGAAVHPLDPNDPLRWGYQVVQPPLYYAIAGGAARLLHLSFAESLVINPTQNPRPPFLRHDVPGQRFPYDAVNRDLHLLRLLSTTFGVLTFVVLRRGFAMVFPGSPTARVFLLAASMLAPNTLQIFAVVANDAQSLLFSAATLVLAIAIVRAPTPGRAAFLLAGICAGLAALSKITGLAAVAAAASLFAIDGFGNRRLAVYVRGIASFLPPLLLLAGPWFGANWQWYGSFTGESQLLRLTPAFHLDRARSLSELLAVLRENMPSTFVADLAWQSIQLPGLSKPLFWLWLLCVAASAPIAWMRRRAAGRIRAELFLPVVVVGWSLVLLVSVNRQWRNLQIRHVWCLYPFTLIGVALVAQALPAFARAWRRVAVAGAVAGMLLLNALLLGMFASLYAPGKAVDRMDRDYRTFLYTWARDQNRAVQYLRSGR